jgi:aspartate/methionine/tyrosine aminotransferase
MNFKEYKVWQKEYLKTHPNIFRADCLNPFKSMDYLLKELKFTSTAREEEEVYSLWKSINKIDIPKENLALSIGVRDSLARLFEIFKDKDIHIPKDIYPRYFELSKHNKVKHFSTYPLIDWEALKRIKNAIILLTIPFTPMGSILDKEGILHLQTLIKNNYIIIDSVYAYDFTEQFNTLKALLKTQKVFLLHSLSKTYLCPEILGINYIPQAYQKDFKSKKNYQRDFSRAYDILKQSPKLPSLQAKAFEKGLDFFTQKTGLELAQNKEAYFRVIKIPFQTLLERNILSVPASVFGSEREDLSVVTGLFYLGELEESEKGTGYFKYPIS